MNAVVRSIHTTTSAAEALRAHEARIEGHRATVVGLTAQIERCTPAIEACDTKLAALTALQQQRRAALIAASEGDGEATARARHLKRDIEAAEDELVVLEHRAGLARKERDRLNGLLTAAERALSAEESERPVLECNLDDEALDAVMREWDEARETVKRLEQQAREIASRHDARATDPNRGKRMAGVLTIQASMHERAASECRRLGTGQ